MTACGRGDREQTLSSLGALVSTRADIVFPGHGEPWRTGIQAAVEHARTHCTDD